MATRNTAAKPAEKLTAEQKAERSRLPADVQMGTARHPDDPVQYKPEEAVAAAQKRTSQWATPAKQRAAAEGE